MGRYSVGVAGLAVNQPSLDSGGSTPSRPTGWVEFCLPKFSSTHPLIDISLWQTNA